MAGHLTTEILFVFLPFLWKDCPAIQVKKNERNSTLENDLIVFLTLSPGRDTLFLGVPTLIRPKAIL